MNLPYEINLAIAEACGWKARHNSHKCDGTTIFRCGTCGLGHSNCYGGGRGAVSFSCSVSPCCDEAVPPDYCGDLNAMHDAENWIIANKSSLWLFQDYAQNLRKNFQTLGLDGYIHATARQRAEAFLRTIGKWKEEA